MRSCNYCYNTVNSCVKPTSQQLKTPDSIEVAADPEGRLSNLCSGSNSSQNQLPKVFHDLFGANEASTSNEINRFRSPRRSVDESGQARRQSVKKAENPMQSTPNLMNENLLQNMQEKIDRRKKQLFISSEENPLEPSWVKEIDQKESSSFDNLNNSEIDSIEIVMEEDSNLLSELRMNETDYQKHFLTTNEPDKNEELYSSSEQINRADTIDNLIKSSAVSTSLLTFGSDDQLNDDLINAIPILFNREEQLERNEQDERIKCQFNSVFDKFFTKLALQLLKKEKLASSWLPVLRDLVGQVTASVKPNADLPEEMDIRKHVKIKTITGGNKQDSRIYNGVVFTKHVAHRKMRKEIENPKILLLTCPIVFQQRMYQKFISFEKLFLQETNYLENLIEKIASFKPNIIIVDKIVSIKAQELLCKKKITVVYNVKSNILYKISRLTNGEIVDSIDTQINCPRFGKCDSFYLKTFNNNQTLMFFDGCKPDSGCTILLRGSIFKKELKSVKKILQFLIFCEYNWKYERAFLLSSSAYLNPATLNEFEQFYEGSRRANSKDENRKSQDYSQESSKEIVLTQLNSVGDDQDPSHPLMSSSANNTSTGSALIDGHLDSSAVHSCCQEQLTKENITSMCNFINEQVLSISPFIYYKCPYLLTNESERCLIKQYVSCKNLFDSARFQEYVNSNKICLMVDDAPYKKEESFNELKNTETHPFLLTDLKHGANSEQSQSLLALYRSSDLIELNNRQHRRATPDEEGEEKCIDPFSEQIHQVFPVLYCNYSLSSSQNPFCIQPAIMQMEFYVEHDFSLGSYLRKYCFTPSSTNVKCECGNSNIEHISKFSHNYGSIYVRCKELNKNTKRPNFDEIITWSSCQICKSSSPSKILSKDALSLSFGKFLQLKIYGNHFRRANCEQSCLGHSLFHDHFQYFAYQDMVASFKYYPVILREIVLPCSRLNLNIEVPTIAQLQVELPELHKIGFQIMSKIFEQICAYQAECDHNENDLQFKMLFAGEVKDRFDLKAKLDEIQDLLEHEPTMQLRVTIMNKFVLLRQLIASFVSNWNSKLNEYEANRKKEDGRLSSVVRSAKFPRLHSMDVDQQGNNLSAVSGKLAAKTSSYSYSRQSSTANDQHPIIRELMEASMTNESNSDGKFDSPPPPDNAAAAFVDSAKLETGSKTNSMVSSRVSSFLNSQEDLSVADEQSASKKAKVKVDSIKSTGTSDQNESDARSDSAQNIIDKLTALGKSGSSESISSIVFGSTPGIKAVLGNEIILNNSESDNENYEVVHSSVKTGCDQDGESVEQQAKEEEQSAVAFRNQTTSSKLESKLSNLQVQSQAMSLMRNQSVISQKKEPIRQSVKSLINNFLSGTNTLIVPDPFLSSQHYLLPMREKLPVLLDDNDLGSIIAYSLTTIDYERKLHEIQSSIAIQKSRYNSVLASSMSTTSKAPTDGGSKDACCSNANPLQEAFSSSHTVSSPKDSIPNDNIDVQFNDATTNYYCCIHFASQFRKLRADVLDTSVGSSLNQTASNLSSSRSSHGSSQATASQHSNQPSDVFQFDTEEAYIRSISQTVEWVAKGGKSKASFSKTLNDRFVIKVVRKADIQLFTQMAGSYFEHMQRTTSECKPTLFAKIIGAYSVSWKDNVNNTSMKKYVLVMENVFFGRRIKQKFDLKGSEKNRLASTKTSDDVLLDENLTKIIRDNPFYLRNHSKLVLQEAIENDSKFLCSSNVIDYSLLVGIDEERRELVVAIIDYIQTYTSIKKMETVFKSLGNFSSTARLPTVVDPQTYMVRFQNKMDQYFQCLPDQWYGLVYSLR